MKLINEELLEDRDNYRKAYKRCLELLTECWNQCLCDYSVDETEWNPEEHEGMLAELARDIEPFLKKAHNGELLND